jgi:hypothetical protein
MSPDYIIGEDPMTTPERETAAPGVSLSDANTLERLLMYNLRRVQEHESIAREHLAGFPGKLTDLQTRIVEENTLTDQQLAAFQERRDPGGGLKTIQSCTAGTADSAACSDQDQQRQADEQSPMLL